MKQRTATVWLVILNTLAFFAGAWAALSLMTSLNNYNADLTYRILFLAVLPAPLVFVWRFFRFKYGFTKSGFFLCTFLPPIIFMIFFGEVMILISGLVGLVVAVVYHIATICLIISTVIWISAGGPCRNRVSAIILLTVCSALILGRLYGLLNNPIPMAVTYPKKLTTAALVAQYALGKLVPAAVWALPIGCGASALMKIYRDEYSLKPRLFMLCAFLPTMLIAGLRLALIYFGGMADNRYRAFASLLDTLILTAAIAMMSAAISALTAFIRNRRHSY